MFCYNCGFEVEKNTLICPVCGAVLQENQENTEEDKTILIQGASEQEISEEEGTTVLSRNSESVFINEDEDETTVLSKSVPRSKTPVLTADQMTNERPEFLMHQEPIILNNLKKPENKSNPLIKAVIIALILAVAAGIGAVLWIYIPKFSKYNDAEEMLSDGKVEDAISLYTELSGFKDSDEKVNGGAYYQYATELFNDQDYQNAAIYYLKAAAFAYEDSENLSRESYYKYGENQRAALNYDEAAAAFASAGIYEDAEEREKECYYAKAETYFEASDYETAIDGYLSAGDYSDASEKIGICYYYKAEEYRESEDYLNAYDYYKKSEYDDYMDKAYDCLYQYAYAAYNEEKYDLALKNYEKIDSTYIDVTDEMDDCYIALAKQAEDAGTYPSAVEYYEKVIKKDVSADINRNKMSYINVHYDSRDEITMGYLCDLKYCGVNNNYDTSYKQEAITKYNELTGWTINSFINSSKYDFETRASYADVSGTTYVHTYFTNDAGYELDLYGYIVYSNNTTSNTISFENIVSNNDIWISVDATDDVAGEAVLYIYEASQNKLVEKYTFTIR